MKSLIKIVSFSFELLVAFVIVYGGFTDSLISFLLKLVGSVGIIIGMLFVGYFTMQTINKNMK